MNDREKKLTTGEGNKNYGRSPGTFGGHAKTLGAKTQVTDKFAKTTLGLGEKKFIS